MISHAIQNAFRKARQRNWNKIYFAFDIHDTILKANYDHKELPTTMFSQARHVLEYISEREDIVMIIYTCSHEHELIKYVDYFKLLGINFEYTNSNPCIETNHQGYGCYDKKMYFDVLFEDKAGFVPQTDWTLTYDTLKKEPLLTDQSTYSIYEASTDNHDLKIFPLEIKLSYQKAKDAAEQYNKDREGYHYIVKEPVP